VPEKVCAGRRDGVALSEMRAECMVFGGDEGGPTVNSRYWGERRTPAGERGEKEMEGDVEVV